MSMSGPHISVEEPRRTVVPFPRPRTLEVSPLSPQPLVHRVKGTRTGLATTAVYLASDLAAIGATLAISGGLSHWLAGVPFFSLSALEIQIASSIAVSQLVMHACYGLYSPTICRPAAEVRWLTNATAIITALALAAVLLSNLAGGYAAWILASGLLLLLALPVARTVAREVFSRTTWWGRRAIFIGSGEAAAALYSKLLRQPRWGLRPVGIVDDLDTLASQVEPQHYLGPPELLADLVVRHRTNLAIVASCGENRDLRELALRGDTGISEWIVLHGASNLPSLWSQATEVASQSALHVVDRLHSPVARFTKRSIDLLLAACIAPLIVPLMMAIAILIRLNSPGPVLFAHERIGRHGKRFKVWKFRTMHRDAERRLREYLDSDPALLAEWQADQKLRNDPRIHWIGRLLRKTSLDELPQIWNVLRGEMSLVGPRPIVTQEIDKYAQHYEQYVKVLPGVTGLWQISGRNNTTYEERVLYDAYYVKNWSPWLDVYILGATARVVLLGEGAY